MIRIRRTDPPGVLQSSKAKQAYRDQQVVKALWRMQKRKCCYCESLIPESGHGKAVEHRRPQARFPSSRNDWNNLLLACPQCNGYKSDKFPVVLLGMDDTIKIVQARHEDPGKPAILDPCDKTVDPEEHIDFVLALNNKLCGLMFARSVAGKKSRLGQEGSLNNPAQPHGYLLRIFVRREGCADWR